MARSAAALWAFTFWASAGSASVVVANPVEIPDVVLDGDIRPSAPLVEVSTTIAAPVMTTATTTTATLHAPVPSGAAIATKAPPLAGVPQTSSTGARIAALTRGVG